METETSERKDEQSLQKQAPPAFVFLEKTLFIVERVAIFFLIFWRNNPNYMDFAVESLLLTNFIYTTLFLGELPYESQWTVGRVLFYFERYAVILAAVHYVFGYSSFWSQAAIVFCFTNTIYIMKFMFFIHEKVEKLTMGINDKRLKRMKAELEELMNQNPFKVVDELRGKKVEPKEEPPKAEVPVEEKVEIVKQNQLLEAEVPLEDKLPERNKELLKEANGEGNQDLQQPWKAKLDDYFLKMFGLLRDQIEVTQKLVNDLLEEEDDDDDEDDDEEKEEEEEEEDDDDDDENEEKDDYEDEEDNDDEDEDEEDVDYMDEEDDEGEEEELEKSTDKCDQLVASAVRSVKFNLEKGENNLTAKLAALSASLEHYHRIEKDYIEDRNKWEIEKKDLCSKLDATLQANLAALKADLNLYQTRYQNAVNELSVSNSWYQYYLRANRDYQRDNRNLLEEKNKLSAKLHSANTSAQFYQACFEDSDKECGKLREDNCTLSEKLFAETSSAQHYQKLFKEMDEKCRKLEEQKDDLAAKLSAAKAACELYRSYLQHCRF